MWVSDSYEDIERRARSRLSQGDMAGALEDYQRLGERLAGLKPSLLERRPVLRQLHAISLAQQAHIRHWQGDFARALDLYRQLSSIAPQGAAQWRQMTALAHIDMGQVETGLDELRAEAVATAGNYEIWLRLGAECDALGRLDEAEENLRRGLKNAATPDSKLESCLALFDFYRAHGRADDALTAWQHGWAARGTEPDYVFPLYQMMWENNRLDEARRYLEGEKNPMRRGLYQGLFAADEGNADESRKHWQRVSRMDSLKHDDGHEAWAEAALRVDVPAGDVVAALSEVLQKGQLNLRGMVLLAAAEARLGRADHAERALQAALNVERTARPRREKLPASDWALLNELVADDAIKQPLCHLFEGSPAPQ
jgi:tetratricopeptide (TPR) repeat protein